VEVGDPSTSLGFGPYSRIIKDSRMIKDPCAYILEDRGEKGNLCVDRGPRGAEAPRKYFR